MPRYIALLRSVNVGGRSLPMAKLRDALETAGCADVVTYIQSGNALFTSTTRSEPAAARLVESAIADATGSDVPVIVRTPKAIESVIARQPLARRHDAKSLHVTFLGEKAAAARVKTIDGSRYLPDEFVVDGREVYIATPNGYGRSKLTNTFFERALQTVATTRNWNTVQKLLALAS